MLVKPVKTDGSSFSENTRNSHRRYFEYSFNTVKSDYYV